MFCENYDQFVSELEKGVHTMLIRMIFSKKRRNSAIKEFDVVRKM